MGGIAGEVLQGLAGIQQLARPFPPGRKVCALQPAGELVTAEAGNQVSGTHLAKKNLAQLDQRRIAPLMAMKVVDQLEIVEVTVDQDRRMVGGRDRLVAAPEFVEEGSPVEQSGQPVGAGQFPQLLVVGDLFVGDPELVGDFQEQPANIFAPGVTARLAP